MNITLLEPFYTGSHADWIDEYVRHSRHKINVLSLSGHHWKWRMHGGAVTLARKFLSSKQTPDLLLATDMLDLTTFLALTRKTTANLPTALYFHENQLTYPIKNEKERDYQFGFTQITSCLASDAVWFNSAFHHDEFLDALRAFLKRMPDNRPLDAIDEIRNISSVHPPGIKTFPARTERKAGPMRIVWAEIEKEGTIIFNHRLACLCHLDGVAWIRFEYAVEPKDGFRSQMVFSDPGREIARRFEQYG